MDFFHPQEIRAVLERHGFHFSKALGQNFLTQAWVPERMMTDSGVDRDCMVLEIGPGMGTLTQAIARYAEKVVAVELDHALIPVLDETLAEFDNVTVLEGDILKKDLNELCEQYFAGAKRKLVCANLPYYITTPILSYLLESRLFDGVCVMMQKEVALRLCAKCGTADYGAFTVFTQYYAEPEILFSVPSSCFVPQPKVDSAIVFLKTRSEPPVPVTDEKLFFKVVRASFAQRRKKLVNGLASVFGDKERLVGILQELGFSENVRGETLGIPDFAKIANKLAE